MKFWQKIFIGTMIIFILAFDAGVLYLTVQSYQFTRIQERNSSIREQTVISDNIANSIARTEPIFSDVAENPERLYAILQPLADYYESQLVSLALYRNGEEIFQNAGAGLEINPELLEGNRPQEARIAEYRAGDTRYLLVASVLSSYPELTLIYIRDITHIDEFRQDISRTFLFINVFVLLFLGLAIYIFLKKTTKPISELNQITKEIAGGAYGKRAEIKSKDEFGELANNFNVMADSVEETMETLSKSAETKQQFIDDLAHEMRTPMTSILGYSEYLQKASSNEEERITAARHLHSGAVRLQSLSEKLMDLTRLRNEKIEFQQVEIPKLFETLEELLTPNLESKRQSLVTKTERPFVLGDETLLLSLLSNLVENAARASKSGECILVKAYQEEYPVLEVSDGGVGMEKEELEKVTTAFYRIDKSRSRDYGGVGLGLSIVKQIVDLHEAELEIESEPGKGTRVKVIFPG